MSIATQRGDRGETSLAGGKRVSKACGRVECYGTIDELIAQIGFGRSICGDEEVRGLLKGVQRELFELSSVLACSKRGAPFERDRVERLTAEVHAMEALPGILNDWSIPGDEPVTAALDVARTVCRRAERLAVGLAQEEDVPEEALAYLNRLSDWLWLVARRLDLAAGVDSALRKGGVRWAVGREWA